MAEAPARRGDAGRVALAAAATAVALLLLPLAWLLVSPLFATGPHGGWDAYAAAIGASASIEVLATSILFASGSALLATLVGALCAALVVWTDAPARGLIGALAVLPLFLPALMYGFGWVLLAGPNAGMINQLAGAPLVDIYTLAGLVWVEGLHAVPLVFLLAAGVFAGVPADVVTMATLSGARLGKALRRIVLPAVGPGLLAAFVLVFVRALGAFEIPAMIGTSAGIELVATHIFMALQHGLDSIAQVAAFAGMVMLLSLALLVLAHSRNPAADDFRFAAGETGALRLPLGRWRLIAGAGVLALLALTTLLPLYALLSRALSPRLDAALFWRPWRAGSDWSAANFAKVLGEPGIWAAGGRSLMWGALAGLVLMSLAVVLVWSATRRGSPLANRIVAASHIVFSLPGVIIGLAVMVFYGALTADAALLVAVVYAVRGLPYALVYGQRALQAIAGDLWISGRLSGAPAGVLLRRIVLPLAGPLVFAGAAYILAISIREVSATVLLYRPGQEFLSVYLWQFWQDGELGRFAALSICVTTITSALLLASYRALSRVPGR